MLVVADTSALLAFAASEGLPLLNELFTDVRVPTAVYEECAIPGKPFAGQLREYLESKVVEVHLEEFIIAGAGLGTGELEAMALYKKLHADRLLLDDSRARRVASFNHMAVIGSLGVLLLAKSRGLIPALKPRLESIRGAGIYLGDALVDEALRIAGEV